MARVTGAALAAVLITLAAAGCGSTARSGAPAASSARVSATAYVTALCQAVAPFERDVESRASALSQTGSETPAQGKRALVSYLGTLSHDSSGAVTRLRGAGVPAVTHGATFAARILSTFQRLDGALSRSVTLATRLPTTSRSAFQTAAGTLATAVKDSVGELGSGLGTAGNQALDAAAAKVSACHAA